MVTRVIRDPGDVEKLARFVAARRLPVTVTITAGASRSGLQNRLSHRWYQDVARQLGDRTADEARAECKLAFGVPLLRAENEAFRLAWDRSTGHLTYAEKLDAVQAFDLPVTRLMTVKQMTAYMDALVRHWTPLGVRLTDPEALRYEEEFA
jgi:hypothetical protein